MKLSEMLVIVFWFIVTILFNEYNHYEVMETLEEKEIEYDYSLELRQDDGGCAWIEVRRDSCLFIVDPDSLEEFIIKDNL